MEGKTVLITGATSGIGKATAYRFAQSKMQLILCGRRTEVLDKIREVKDSMIMEVDEE